MAMETDVILRAVLYQLMKAGSLKEAIAAIRAMCPADLYATVEKQVREEKAETEA
jgi:hypothetical protein